MCPSERSDETHYCMLRINFRAHASSFVCVSLSFSSLGLVCIFFFLSNPTSWLQPCVCGATFRPFFVLPSSRDSPRRFVFASGVKPSYSGVAVVMWGKNGNGASSFQSVMWGQGDTLWFASLAALALRMSFASPLPSKTGQSGNASRGSRSLFPFPISHWSAMHCQGRLKPHLTASLFVATRFFFFFSCCTF